MDKHIDTGQIGQLWVLPYNVESSECRRIDAIGGCKNDGGDSLLEKADVLGELNQENAADEHSEQIKGGNSWYVDLLDKLKR